MIGPSGHWECVLLVQAGFALYGRTDSNRLCQLSAANPTCCRPAKPSQPNQTPVAQKMGRTRVLCLWLLRRCKRAGLVLLHEPTETDHIRRPECDEPALHAVALP